MARSYSAMFVHLVFSTKGRRPFLEDPDLRVEMHSFLGGVSKNLGCQPLIVGGVEDHVHILANLGKSTSQSDWVKELKRQSSIWAKQRDPNLREFAWQGGCGVFSVSVEGLPAARNYITNQEEHHKNVSFQEEFIALLKEHGMEWDPRDLLDD
jgi:REP element-mobilizing transposase RayT